MNNSGNSSSTRSRMMRSSSSSVGGTTTADDDVVSHKTSRSHRTQRTAGGRSITSDLEEPLNSNSGDVELGGGGAVNSISNNLDEDPFYVLREDLYRKLELVDESLAEFLRIVYQTDTAVNAHELKDAKKQLKRHVKNAELTLKDVKTTLTVVENDRIHFAHIDNAELYERRSFVHTSQDRLGRAKSEMTSETVKAKQLADERAKAMRRTAESNHNQSHINNNNNNNIHSHLHNGSGSGGGGIGSGGGTLMGSRNDSERENTAFIADSQARTSLLFQQQDETLDDLDEAVIRVGRMAENIHEEIGIQNKMLSELDEDLTDVEEELGVVMGKLAKLLQTKSKWQLGTILLLTVVVIVLVFLVIYS